MEDTDTDSDVVEHRPAEEAPEHTEKGLELLEQAAQSKARNESRHNDMLEAVAEGEDWNVEDYEWVSLGGLELKVKTWIPGDVMDRMGGLAEMAESENPAVARDAIRANVESLTTQTEVIQSDGATFETNADIRQFWQSFVDKWGDQGLERALEAVLEPIEEERDRKEDAIESFRANKRSPSDRGAR